MKTIISRSPTLSAPLGTPSHLGSAINTVCLLQNNQLETSGWWQIPLVHCYLLSAAKKQAKKKSSVFSLQTEQSTPKSLQSQGTRSCSWLWREGEGSRQHTGRYKYCMNFQYELEDAGSGYNSVAHAYTQNQMDRWSLTVRAADMWLTMRAPGKHPARFINTVAKRHHG